MKITAHNTVIDKKILNREDLKSICDLFYDFFTPVYDRHFKIECTYIEYTSMLQTFKPDIEEQLKATKELETIMKTPNSATKSHFNLEDVNFSEIYLPEIGHLKLQYT